MYAVTNIMVSPFGGKVEQRVFAIKDNIATSVSTDGTRVFRIDVAQGVVHEVQNPLAKCDLKPTDELHRLSGMPEGKMFEAYVLREGKFEELDRCLEGLVKTILEGKVEPDNVLKGLKDDGIGAEYKIKRNYNRGWRFIHKPDSSDHTFEQFLTNCHLNRVSK